MTAPPTVQAILAETRQCLARAGVPGAGLDARVLVAHALGAESTMLPSHGRRTISAAERWRIEAMVRRRARREPIAHITGVREFWSLDFQITADTLVPRPDSEAVVEAALAWATGRGPNLSILDLGTGSGCLLLALLHELPVAQGVGVDVIPAALAVARRNAHALGIADRARFVAGDWGRALVRPFDVIVCNPPYVADGNPGLVDQAVAEFEPAVALFGGADGTESYDALVPDIGGLLAPDGAVFLEIGFGQAAAVSAILRGHRMEVIEIKDDLSGIPRCVVARPAS